MSSGRSHPLRRNPEMPPRPVVIVLLFTENAANSSLGINGVPGGAAFPPLGHLDAALAGSGCCTLRS
jgi:hypothetical protein